MTEDSIFSAKRLDGFEHESPIRAFTDFQVSGCYAIGKGFRPSMQHLAVYLDAMERKENWRLVQVIMPKDDKNDPTMIFHRDIYSALMPELKERAGEIVTVVNGPLRDVDPDSVLFQYFECEHPKPLEMRTGDDGLVWFCPECGKNIDMSELQKTKEDVEIVMRSYDPIITPGKLNRELTFDDVDRFLKRQGFSLVQEPNGQLRCYKPDGADLGRGQLP